MAWLSTDLIALQLGEMLVLWAEAGLPVLAWSALQEGPWDPGGFTSHFTWIGPAG